MTAAHLDPTRRHDAVLLFDVTDGNPNGDPDAGNQPRTDDETGHGLVTDVAIKRKIRDTVAMIHGGRRGYGIFVEAGVALTPRFVEVKDARPQDPEQVMCEKYFDIRMFGAVLTAGKAARSASVRGPVQLGFARSLDPVLPIDHTITQITKRRQKDIDEGQTTEIGSKWTVPYGLYAQRIHYSAPRGAKTGVTGDDLAALWQAIMVMFDHDRSATRGVMEVCGLWVFSHENQFGVASAGALARKIRVERTKNGAPRAYTDYRRAVRDDLPDGVELTTLVDVWS